MDEIINPVLYIIMRKDIPQMNPGKGMAQAAHAANLFQTCIEESLMAKGAHYHGTLKDAYNTWRGDRGFGTTIVLEATIDQMHELLGNIGDLEEASDNGFEACCNMVIDPSYPMHNHYRKHFTEKRTTCMYVFNYTYNVSGTMADIHQLIQGQLKALPLHP